MPTIMIGGGEQAQAQAQEIYDASVRATMVLSRAELQGLEKHQYKSAGASLLDKVMCGRLCGRVNVGPLFSRG